MLGKYQVAFSTNARNGNFNQKNPQQQREYQRIKKRQKERKNRGEQNIYPDSPEFQSLTERFISRQFPQITLDSMIGEMLIICIETLYELLLDDAWPEHKAINNFSWFKEITEPQMQHIVNFLYETGHGQGPWKKYINKTIDCIKYVQRDRSILKNFVPEDKRPIYPDSPEFESLKKEYIENDYRISYYIAKNYPGIANGIKHALSDCITHLFERLLVLCDEYVPVNHFIWFEKISVEEMQDIVNYLYETYGELPNYVLLHPTIDIIKHVQRDSSILESFMPRDTRPAWMREPETYRPPFGRGASARSEFNPSASMPAFGRGSAIR